MGRTSDAKERLIEAVIELLWIGGYASTSVDHICARAGVRKGSFYHFFESKTALALAGVDHGWSMHRRKLDEIFSPVTPPLERIRKCLRELRREQDEMRRKHGRVLGCPVHSLGAEISGVEDQLHEKLQKILAQFIRYYESAIREAAALGEITARDPASLARILFAYSEGLLLHARIWNDLSKLDELENGALTILGAKPAAKRARR